MQPLVFWPLLAPRRRQCFSLCALLFCACVYDMRDKKKTKTRNRVLKSSPRHVVSVTRRSSGVVPRACVRVYARVLVPPNLYIRTYILTSPAPGQTRLQTREFSSTNLVHFAVASTATAATRAQIGTHRPRKACEVTVKTYMLFYYKLYTTHGIYTSTQKCRYIICIYVYIWCIYIYIHININVYIYIQIYIYRYIYTYMYVCT